MVLRPPEVLPELERELELQAHPLQVLVPPVPLELELEVSLVLELQVPGLLVPQQPLLEELLALLLEALPLVARPLQDHRWQEEPRAQLPVPLSFLVPLEHRQLRQ